MAKRRRKKPNIPTIVFERAWHRLTHLGHHDEADAPPAPGESRWASLRSRFSAYPSNVNRMALINFCQHFHLYIHAYGLLLLSRGLTLVEISLIESLVIGTIFLMEVPTGILADRLGRRWSIIVSLFLLMLAEFIFLFAHSFEWYLFIAVLTGSGIAFESGAVEALVYDSLPKENRENAMKRAMGLVHAAAEAALFLSPIVGGIIVADAQQERFYPAIALTVLFLLVSLAIAFGLCEPETDSSAEKLSSLNLFRESVVLLINNHELRRLAPIVIFTTPFTAILITTLAPPYLVENEVSPLAIGMALSIGSLLAAFSQRYAYKVEDWLGMEKAIAVLILLPGLLYWLLALVSGPILTSAVVILMYGLNDMKAPVFSAHENELIESRNRATVLCLIMMLESLFLAIGTPIYAALAQTAAGLAFAVIGTVIISAGLLLWGSRWLKAR